MSRDATTNVAGRLLQAEQRAGRKILIQKVIEQRFGPLPAELVERVQHANMETLSRWALRVNMSNSLDEVFAG